MVVGACVLALCTTAVAKDGTVRGTLTGVPANSAFTAITAVNGHGVIGGIGTANPAGRYSLTLAPGTWLLAAATGSEVEPPGSPPYAFGVVRVRAGRTATGQTLPASTARAGSGVRLTPGSVVTVPTVGMEDFRPDRLPGNNYDFTSLVQNDLFRLCSPHGIVFADTSPDFIKAARRESNLSASGQLSTPFTYRPIRPEYTVGTLEQDLSAGHVELGLEIRAIKSPDWFDIVTAQWGSNHEESSANAPIPSDADVVAVVHAAGRKLAAKICGA